MPAGHEPGQHVGAGRPDVALAAARSPSTLRRVGVDADARVRPASGERDGEREADVAGADDRDVGASSAARMLPTRQPAGAATSSAIRPAASPVAVERRVRRRAARVAASACRDGRTASRLADQPVPAQLDRLDPLAGVAQRHARHPVQVGLLLHAAGVGQAHAGRRQQRGEVEVAERRGDDRGRLGPLQQAARASSAARVRGCSGNTSGSLDRPPAPRPARPSAAAGRCSPGGAR